MALIVSLGGEGDFERTKSDRVNFVPYRRRRDFLESILETDWKKGVEHKWAALERAHFLPSTASFWMVCVRLVPFLLLLCGASY